PPRRPPSSTLLPYTTLFRSPRRHAKARHAKQEQPEREQEWRQFPAPLEAVEQQEGDDRRQQRHLAGEEDVRHVQPPLAVQIEQRSEEHTSELQSRENLVCRL